MQTAISLGDRNLLIVAVLLISALSVVALVFSPQRGSESLGSASSYSTANDGSKAAYMLLGEMGYSAERWVNPPQDLSDLVRPGAAEDSARGTASTVLVLADPRIPASSEEKSGLRNFVQQGGRVLATGALATILVPEITLKTVAASDVEAQTFAAELPSPLTRGAPEISMKAYSRWSALSAFHMRYYGDAEGGIVVRYPLGKGEVIWWADSGPLTNYGLTQASNSMLFLNSIGEPSNTRVLWDEYFHGQHVGLWSYLGRTPVPWSLVQLSLVLAAALVTFGRRNGPLRALAHESRLSPVEFVETLGDLYQRKGGAAEALEIAYHRFRFLLLKRLGLAPNATSVDIQRGVRDRLGWAVPGFSETLQRCDLGVKNPRLSASRSLHLIQELHDYSRRFGLGKTETGN